MNSEKTEITRTLASALSTLSRSVSPRFVPSGGADIAFAKEVSRDPGDIASAKWGVAASGGSSDSREPDFGTGGYMAKVLLTAMKFDPLMRSAAIIRCTPEMVRMFDELFFESCSFDPLREPPGISTMDWGVASCCRHGVPDVIYSIGSAAHEPLARFFGEDPDQVVNNIIMVTGRIIDAH